jgi:hypothetical protein
MDRTRTVHAQADRSNRHVAIEERVTATRVARVDREISLPTKRGPRVAHRHLPLAITLARTDLIGIGIVFTISLIGAGQLLAGGILIGQDAATQFYPWYAYLGGQLRSFEIPGWNPYQFSGAPFAADPQSGWMYLPAMLLFTVLPLSFAVPAFLWLHLMLAGSGTYLLSRLLGMPMAGAIVAAAAYELTGPVYGRSACCPAAVEVSVWTPWVLAGADLAIRASSNRARLVGWVLAGFALSQSLAAWLGQGSYYVLMALGAFVVYRSLTCSSTSRRIQQRLAMGALNGAAVVLVGFGLAAAGIVPRLAYIARSTLSDGEYDGPDTWAAKISGVSSNSVFDRLLAPTLHYPGAAVIALALVGLLVSGRLYATPFFAALGVTAAVLASPESTPLHSLLYTVLPRFESLHRHWPERVSLVSYIAPAILAGAAVGALCERPKEGWSRRLVIGLPIAAAVALWLSGAGVPENALVAIAATVLLLAILAAAPAPLVTRAVPIVLVAVIAVDLIGANRSIAGEAPYGGFHRRDLDSYYAPTDATEFLRDRAENGPFRMFGYDPSLRSIQDGQTVLYRRDFPAPSTRALQVNNRATVWGIWDIQGYNPVQPERYSELMSAVNGHAQDYHDANVFPDGVGSALLDLLNVRYVVVPAHADVGLPDFQWLVERLPTVYEDAEVMILERESALPRAWVVHDIRPAADNETLELLVDGTVDPGRTALVDDGPIPVEAASTGAKESVSIVEHESDTIRARSTTGSSGMVVFSEMFDPGWSALIDGVTAPLHRVDFAVMGVVVPAGVHVIELRYRSPGLLLGAAISLLTVAAILCAFAWFGINRQKQRPTSMGRRRSVARSGRNAASIRTGIPP